MTMRLVAGVGCAFAQVLLLAGAVAQAPKGPVRIVGRIVSVLHEGVPAAEVWVTDAAGKTLGRTTADGDGYYQLHRLPSVPMHLHARGADKVEGSIAIVSNGLVRAATLPLEDGDPLRGTVKDVDGTPVAGAAVLVTAVRRIEPPYDWWEETTTAADGSWSLPCAPLRPLVVRAFVPGRPLAELEVGPGRAGDAAVQLPAGTPLTRTVRVSGVPAGATAVVWGDLGLHRREQKRLPQAALEAVVAADGTAQFWALPAKHEVRVRLAGHSSMPVYVPSAENETRALEFAMTALPADVVAPKTRISGRIVDSVGVALPGVTILGKLDHVYGEPVVSGADGSFALDVPVRSGVIYRLALTTPGWRLGGFRASLESDGLCWWSHSADPAKPIELQACPTGIVRGVLEGPNGAPLAAAMLRVGLVVPDPVGDARKATTALQVMAASDAAGRVEFSGLPAGNYRLLASGVGVPLGQVEFTVKAEGVTTLGAVTFQPMGEVTGVVTGPDGTPLASEPFFLIDARAVRGLARFRGGLVPAESGVGTVMTDRRGRYRLPVVLEGEWAFTQVSRVAQRVLDANQTTFTVEPGKRITCDVAVPR